VENLWRNQPLKSMAAAIVENADTDSLASAVIASTKGEAIQLLMDCRAARRPKDGS
jgi:hypothetical protein